MCCSCYILRFIYWIGTPAIHQVLAVLELLKGEVPPFSVQSYP